MQVRGKSDDHTDQLELSLERCTEGAARHSSADHRQTEGTAAQVAGLQGTAGCTGIGLAKTCHWAGTGKYRVRHWLEPSE